MLPSTFVMWSCSASSLPIPWREVRSRVEAAGVRRDLDQSGPSSVAGRA
jgi:hypothetical protein